MFLFQEFNISLHKLSSSDLGANSFVYWTIEVGKFDDSIKGVDSTSTCWFWIKAEMFLCLLLKQILVSVWDIFFKTLKYFQKIVNRIY